MKCRAMDLSGNGRKEMKQTLGKLSLQCLGTVKESSGLKEMY